MIDKELSADKVDNQESYHRQELISFFSKEVTNFVKPTIDGWIYLFP